MIKRIITIVLVVALVATVAVAAIPSWRNTVMSWFSSETQVDGSTEPTDSTDPTESTTPTDETQGTEPTDPTEGEDVSEPEEITGMDLTFEQLWELIHTPEGDIRIAYDGVVADLTYEGGNFKPETEAEQEELFAGITNTDHGVFSVWNEMFTVERKHGVGISDELHLSLCDNTKCGHKAHLYENWSVNNLTAAEGNEALSPESWTYMEGQPTEVLFSYEEREIIRAAACTWTVVNESGEVVRYYGLRVCGVPTDPEPPVQEDPVNEFEVSFKFVAANGATLPNGVLSQRPASVKVNEGETFKVNYTFKSVETEAGTWTFKSWDKTSFKVTGNVTVTGTWVFTETPGEGGEPEKETYTVTYQFVATSGTLPSAVTNLKPAAKTVEEGTVVTSPSIVKEVKVDGGVWTNSGWDKASVTVNGNVTVTMKWTFTANPVVEEYTVSYKFVGTKGESLPQEVMNMLPASVTVKKGTIVTPRNLSGVEVEVSNGTWKFQGWDKSSANVSSDTTFTGSWKFVEKLSLADPVEDYNISFKFVSATSGKSLPASVTGLKPATIVAQKGETVTAPSIKPIVEVDGGKWVFNGWSSNSITVVGDATITGSWTFEKDPEPEHTPTNPEGDEDPNPVAENQDELDELGDRTDEVPEEENTPEHSEKEDLSLMPVGEEGSDGEESEEDGINNQHSPVDNVARSEVDAEEEKTQSDNELSLIPVGEDVDSTDDVEEGESGLTLADPVDDSVVADDATQNELDSMFPGRE